MERSLAGIARRDRRQGAAAHRHRALPPRARPSVRDRRRLDRRPLRRPLARARRDLHPTLARARSLCPVARSDEHGGYWVVTRYEDVLRVAQDWETFSNELGITVPAVTTGGAAMAAGRMKILPVGIDPPLQRDVQAADQPVLHARGGRCPGRTPTRALVTRLIDGFVEHGECDFMDGVRPAATRASPSSTWRCTRRPRTSSRSTTGPPLASLTAPPEAADVRCRSWPRGSRSSSTTRREPARGGDVVDAVHGRRDRGPAHHRRRGHRHRSSCSSSAAWRPRPACSAWRCCASARTPRSPSCCGPARAASPTRSRSCCGSTGRSSASAARPATTPRSTVTRSPAGERVIIYWASANRDEGEFDRPRRVRPRPRRQPPHRLRRRAPPLRRVEPGPHEPAHRPRGARRAAAATSASSRAARTPTATPRSTGPALGPDHLHAGTPSGCMSRGARRHTMIRPIRPTDSAGPMAGQVMKVLSQRPGLDPGGDARAGRPSVSVGESTSRRPARSSGTLASADEPVVAMVGKYRRRGPSTSRRAVDRSEQTTPRTGADGRRTS